MLRPALRSVLFGGLPSINPLSLFSAGQQGGWWEAFDPSTLSQDSAGTTPVTTAGQPNGLLLDKSQGLVVGPELVVNGDFASGTDDWARTGAGASWSVSSGILTLSATAFSAAYTTFAATVGNTYIIRILLKGGSVSAITAIGSTPGGSDLFSSVATLGSPVSDVQLQYKVIATTTLISIKVGTYASGSTSWAAVSSWSLGGNHAFQATSAARPTYQITPARLTVDRVDDRLQVTVPAGGFVGTLVLSTKEGTLAYGVSIPAGTWSLGSNTSSSTAYFPGTAVVGALVRHGALSQNEIDRLYKYFVANGGGPSGAGAYAGVTSFANYWRGASWLTSFPAGVFNTLTATNFTDAWTGCGLDQASVDAILVSINAAGTSNGTLGISGGTNATPSATGQAATDALRARGWTVTLNGY